MTGRTRPSRRFRPLVDALSARIAPTDFPLISTGVMAAMTIEALPPERTSPPPTGDPMLDLLYSDSATL